MNSQMIDRLVTGDLNELERRELLHWLDAEPDRWRRCALAFLEAQLWTATFGTVTSRPQHRESQSIGRAMPRPQRKWLTAHRSRTVVVAATLLISFGLGLIAGSAVWRLAPVSNSAVPLAHGKDLNADRPHRESPAEADLAAITTSDGNRESDRDDPSSLSVQKVAVLKIPTKGEGVREVQLPVQEVSAVDKRWLSVEPESIPASIQRQLEQRGFQLEQSRKFIEVQLEDGRNAVVPVDQYNVKFVGHRSS